MKGIIRFHTKTDVLRKYAYNSIFINLEGVWPNSNANFLFAQ